MSRLEGLWVDLLSQNPTNEDLRYVIEWVEPLRERAENLRKRSKKEILNEMRIV